MAPRVFCIQQPTRLGDDGEPCPSMDLSPAEDFGVLEFILSPSAHALGNDSGSLAYLTQAVERCFMERGLTDQDYLLLVGQPSLIAVTAAIAARVTGGLRLLQWQRALGCYEQLWVALPLT